MKKITLLEAKELLEEIKLVDVFSSLVNSTLEEDYKKLRLYNQLTNKIYKAEKHFNIDDLYNQISLLKHKEEYYAPENIIFYYKNTISKEIKESNNDIYKEILSNIDKIQDKITEISKHVYIEVD